MDSIIQWNCRGIFPNAENLKVLTHDHNAGVICLQETKLGYRNFNPGFNYSFFSYNPPGVPAHGGVAIMVNKGLEHSVVDIKTDLQAVAVKVRLGKLMTVCSIYLPPEDSFSLDPAEFQNLINQLPTPFLVLGDFNAHNPRWGGDRLSPRGRIIETFVNQNNVLLFNDGSFTYHKINSNSYSAIDLSMCSSNLFLDFTWSVDQDLHGSDHYPIFIKSTVNSPTQSPPKWKPEQADWSKYSNGVLLEDFNSFKTHIDAYDHFTDSILTSANVAIPKTKGKPRRPAVPWWNKTCSKLRRITRKCYRKFKSSGSPQAKTTYQRNQAKQRRYFKQRKRESWIYYINGIRSKAPARIVWNKIRKLSGKFVPTPLPSLKVNNIHITDPGEVSEKLGEHFANISSPENYSSEFKEIRDQQITLDFSSNQEESYNMPFSLKELREALTNVESTTPGEDSIIYEMLQYLSESAKSFLLKIINKIWDTGILPESWKIALIVPIKKLGKLSTEPTSYRPISLTSCVCKIMEKMINNRLVWFLEKNNLLSPHQYGFRKNRSTLDPLLKISNEIQKGFVEKGQTIGVFFDLEKAYDTTWRGGIIQEFHKMGIRGNMIKFINEFLSDRFLKVRVGDSVSKRYKQEEGVPQGSVLSVTCFSVAINKIVEAVCPPVKCSLFVDDFALYCRGYDAVQVCKHLQKAINAVSKWADSRGFRFSTTKTTAVRFARHLRKETIPTLTLKGSILPYEDQVKFLGLIFDKRLTWGPHIDSLKKRVKKSLDILKVVSSYDWGADKKSLLKLYDAVCRSKLDYACQIYSSACETQLKKLDVVHNMGLRICTGAFKTSPIESIYVDAEQLPLELRREELGLRYYVRLKSSVNNPAVQVLNDSNPKPYLKPKASKPFQIRLQNREIKSQKIDKVTCAKYPPWLIPEVNCCEKSINKKNMTPEEIKTKFLEHVQVHRSQKQKQIYTDGSKSVDGVGFAIRYSRICSESDRMSNSASVFTAELTAIKYALVSLFESPQRNFVLFTDSSSAIAAIKQFNSKHPIVGEIREWLFKLHTKFKKVQFCWVPAHVGIQGNEIADKLAKQATKFPNVKFDSVPHIDLKRPIRSLIQDKWQNKWSSPALQNNKKLKKIRPVIDHWPSSFHPNRRHERSLTRLRIGHTKLTHGHLMRGDVAPRCNRCNVTLTVEHVLAKCRRFETERRLYLLYGKNIAKILNDNVDDNVFEYLKEINLYYEI